MSSIVAPDGATIAWSSEGEGEPVAFLNGVMMTMQSWVLQKPVFVKRYRCIFHDFRGQLLSPAPPAPFTMETHAEDFLRLLDELQIDRCHLIGTSYGGEVALVFAAAHPERVKSVAVIGSVSHVEAELDERVGRWAELALNDRSSLYRFSLDDNFSKGFREKNGWILEQGETRLAGYADQFFTDFARLVESFRELDVRERLRSIRAPVLVMVGELDRLKPVSCSRELAGSLPDAEFLIVGGAGHAAVIEKSAEVNTALLGWIEKQRWN